MNWAWPLALLLTGCSFDVPCHVEPGEEETRSIWVTECWVQGDAVHCSDLLEEDFLFGNIEVELKVGEAYKVTSSLPAELPLAGARGAVELTVKGLVIARYPLGRTHSFTTSIVIDTYELRFDSYYFETTEKAWSFFLLSCDEGPHYLRLGKQVLALPGEYETFGDPIALTHPDGRWSQAIFGPGTYLFDHKGMTAP